MLYLPAIVEAAESSPSAAKEAAQVIRKFLGKDNLDKPYVQYNGIMLIRILADNPGKTFTRNIDAKFVQTVKELLRVGRDPSVKQILMETLDTFGRDKQADETLTLLNEMWKKEHERMVKIHVRIPFEQLRNILLTLPRVKQALVQQTQLPSIPIHRTTSPEITIPVAYLILTN